MSRALEPGRGHVVCAVDRMHRPSVETAGTCVRGDARPVTLLAGMSQILDDMMAAIGRATRRVWIETYIVRDDRLGWKLADALAAARARGVDVRLLFDALGSERMPASFFEHLRASGVDARAYRPLARSFVRLFPRNHARNMLVDDVAYAGGSAWGDEWLPVAEGGKGWHDVCVRVVGPAASALEQMYEARWARTARDELAVEAASEVIRCGDVTVISDLARGAAWTLGAYVRAVRRARRRVWIENSYFFAPRELLAELFRAARRGVDVLFVLPRETDLRIITYAARGEYERWLRAGIRIAEYAPTVLHSKIAVVDDDWCTVGTFNINATSVACAHEINVVVEGGEVVDDVARQIARDLDVSEVVTIEDIRRWSLFRRCLQFFAARLLRALEWPLARQVPSLLWSRRRARGVARRAPPPGCAPAAPDGARPRRTTRTRSPAAGPG